MALEDKCYFYEDPFSEHEMCEMVIYLLLCDRRKSQQQAALEERTHQTDFSREVAHM